MTAPPNQIVHLELRTGNLPRALAFYSQLFGWRPERHAMPCGSYTSLETGGAVEGGVIEHDADGGLWLPYVGVADVAEVTDRARMLGASVALEPREGPAGWRSVVADPAGCEIALWRPKS